MRVIQAGVGGFGESWIWAVKNVGFEQVALVDPNTEMLERAGNAVGVPPERRFSSLAEALSKVEADGYLDVSPAHLHAANCRSALEAGLHVLCEKPLTENLADAQALVRLAKQKDRVLMVTQQKRYENDPRQLRKLLDEGAIGEVDHAVIEFQVQGVLSGWRTKMRHPFLLDMGIHHFDLMRYILNRNPLRVTANSWNPKISNTQGDNCAFVLVEFEGGVRVNYTGSFASPGTETGWNGKWTITGTHGSLVWNQRDEWGQIRIFRQDADLSQFHSQHFFEGLGWGHPIPAADIGAKGHHSNLYQWRDCIQNHWEPETSGRDNLYTLALTFGAMDSADTCRTVEIPQNLDAD